MIGDTKILKKRIINIMTIMIKNKMDWVEWYECDQWKWFNQLLKSINIWLWSYE